MKTRYFSKSEKRFWAYFVSWLLIFVAGAVVYGLMYKSYPFTRCEQGLSTAHSVGEEAIRAMSSSFDLFFFNIDSNCIDGWLEDGDGKEGLGWGLFVVALCAGLWTISLAVSLAWALLRKSWRTRKALYKKDSDLYIFIGINNRSKLLAKNILEQSAGNTVCLFLVPPEANQESETSLWNRVFKSAHYKRNLYKELGKMDAQVLITDKRIVDCVEVPGNDVWKELGEPIIKQYIDNSIRTHILLLSDNETDNVLGARKLNDDVTLNMAIHPSTIVCMARRNSINRVLEDMGTDVAANKIELKVIDSSTMAIEHLKGNVQYHPVQFVHFDEKKSTTVDSAFSTMIIGFSECGQDALRFLYEFGTFVDAESANGDKRSTFHCDIVDVKLDEAAERWMHDAPALFGETLDCTSDSRIHIHQIDAHSEAFYSLLDGRMADLNYVVVTVGNDMDGISIAVDILKYAIRTGKSFAQFKVFVRAYDAKYYEYMKDIADHYNTNEERLVVFGQEEELFTKQMIIDDAFAELGKTYHAQYEQCRTENGVDEYPAESWDERREKVFRDKQGVAFLKQLQDLRRKESQDRANALHALTKLAIWDKVGRTDNEDIREKMGWLEHLRWLSAHELMGYTYAPKKDILHYKHDCMIPWSDLKGPLSSTREYDRIVWDTTLKLKEQYEQKGYYTK